MLYLFAKASTAHHECAPLDDVGLWITGVLLKKLVVLAIVSTADRLTGSCFQPHDITTRGIAAVNGELFEKYDWKSISVVKSDYHP